MIHFTKMLQEHHRLTVFFVLLVFSLMATACSTGSSAGNLSETESTAGTEAASNTAENAEGAAQTPEPSQSKPLVVYLNDFDEMIKPLFEEKTGYTVELVTGNGAELQSRIAAEKVNSQWDVVWMDGQAAFSRWDEEGQLLKNWQPANLENLNEMGQDLMPEDDAYFPTGAHAAGVIIYNTNEFTAEEAPRTWAELTQPEFNGEIGMADPAVAAPAYPFVSWFFYDMGMDSAKSYFDELFANGLKVYPKNPNVAEALLSGEIKAAALQESNAYGLKAKGEPVEVIWPEEGAPASVRYVAINNQSENQEAAKAFVEFLLDPQTQREMVQAGGEGYFSPTVKEVEDLPDRPENPKLLVANAAWSAANEAEIKEWFADKAAQ